jgi:hypothetical protein
MALYRQRERLKKLGWTPEMFDAAMREQNGVCAICGRNETTRYIGPAERGTRFAALSADHNHATGKARGLLCRRCNSGLGHFNDDPALLMVALEYLHLHQEVSR